MDLVPYLKLSLIVLIIVLVLITAGLIVNSMSHRTYRGGSEKLIDIYTRGRPIRSTNVAELVEFLRACPFPYLGGEIDVDASAAFLRAMVPSSVCGAWELAKGRPAPGYDSREPFWFELPHASHEILNPTDAFTEDRRLAVSVAGLPSPIDFWNSDAGRETIARWLARQRRPITVHVLHDAFYQADWTKVRPATEFHVAHVVNVLRFAAQELGVETSALRCYDPCAGHGARLFGACVVGARYLACDPDKDLIEPHAAIARHFGAETLARVMPIPAETADAQTLAEFAPNIVFTSPPFFNYEQYALADTSGQSTRNYSDYSVWKEKFLRVILCDAARALVPGGLMFIHLSDVAGYPLAEDMIHMDIQAVFIGAFGLKGDSGKIRPVWCWKCGAV